MKVVVAIDSFKGSMTSMQAGMACKEGILAAIPKAKRSWNVVSRRSGIITRMILTLNWYARLAI